MVYLFALGLLSNLVDADCSYLLLLLLIVIVAARSCYAKNA